MPPHNIPEPIILNIDAKGVKCLKEVFLSLSRDRPVCNPCFCKNLKVFLLPQLSKGDEKFLGSFCGKGINTTIFNCIDILFFKVVTIYVIY